MGIKITKFNGDGNIGLYAYATDKYCLIGKNIKEWQAKEIEQTLNVPVHRMTMCGTDLLGVFCAGTDETLIIPGISLNEERKILKELGINFEVIETKETAIGNNIAVNKNGAIINEDFSANERKKISQIFNVKVIRKNIGDVYVPGAIIAINKKGGLISRYVSDEDKQMLETLFNLKLKRGTLNMGSPFIKSGIIVNSHGMLVSANSGGPEIMNADEAYGFLYKIKEKSETPQKTKFKPKTKIKNTTTSKTKTKQKTKSKEKSKSKSKLLKERKNGRERRTTKKIF